MVIDEKRTVALVSKLILGLKKLIFPENGMLILTKRSISLEDAGNSVRKMQPC